MIIERLVLGSLGTNCYLVYDEGTKEAAIIDPADNSRGITEKIKQLNLNLKYIIITHAHCDHIAALDDIKQEFPNSKICIGKYDAVSLNSRQDSLCALFGMEAPKSKPDILISDGYSIELGEITLNFVHTPGHTRGGVSIKAENILFSGDTLFLESIGRSDFPGGSMSELINSIKEKLFILPNDTIVYPGHGDPTTIGHEKNNNPYVW